ncbi:hypothetical protein [Bradyrhizobium liaoningense]
MDPRHPLYGRRYRLISIGKESTTRGACKELFVRVHYRFGLTLLLPLGVTNLERNSLLRAAPTKLCGFRFIPAGYSDLKPAIVPI